MILIDKKIEELNKKLIDPFDKQNLFGCGYNLKIGSIFEPGTGKEIPIANGLKIPPNGTAIIMTKEVVKLPDNIYATYNPTFDLSRQGILMLNACIVEPNYKGPLSCFFVNLSSVDFCLESSHTIAKIIFFELGTDKPANKRKQNYTYSAYKTKLFQQANKFHTSFLDIKGIENRISKSAEKSMRKSIIWGGTFISVLLLYATIQPLISQYIWDSSSIYEKRMDELNKKVMDNLRTLEDIEKQQKELDSLNMVRIKELKEK